MIPTDDLAVLDLGAATNSAGPPGAIETTLVLPSKGFYALEAAARWHNMTVGQMARLLIARGLATIDQRRDYLPTSSG